MDRNPDAGGFRLGYQPELDGLRGLAVLAVTAYHSGLRRVLPGGFLGVDLFFVLSGFLITALLLREHQQTGAVHLGRFYLRRALRLLPALFVMLAACCLWAALRTNPDRARGIYAAALLTACHAANWDWLCSVRLDLLGHAWSLSLEEQFYLIWPPLLVLLLRRGAGPRRIGWFIVLGMAAAAGCRAALWLGHWSEAAATCPAARADSFLAGCLVGAIASANRLPQSRGSRTALQAAAVASAIFLLFLGLMGEEGAAYLYLGGFTIVAAAAAVVIAALVNASPRPVARIVGAPALAWIGRISYGLYLWHFPMLSIAPKVMHGILPATRGVPGLDDALAFGAAFGMAALSHRVVEKPFLRWKDRMGAADTPRPLIFARSSRRSGPRTPAASSGRAGCPA